MAVAVGAVVAVAVGAVVAVAEAANVSVREVGSILRGERQATPATLAKRIRAVSALEAVERERIDQQQAVLESVREQCQQTSMRQVAAQAEVDAANLSHVLTGRTRPSEGMLAKLEAALVQRDWEHA